MNSETRFSREDIYQCALPQNAYVFENMDDYLTMLALSTKTMTQALREATGLTILQYRILSLVNREETSTVSYLAHSVRTQLSTISSAVSVLCDNGMLRRNEAHDDMRVIMLELTAKGKKNLARANRAVAASASEGSALLSRDQTQALVDASIHVIEAHPDRSFASSVDDASLVVANATFITKELLGERLEELGLIPRDYRVMLTIHNMNPPVASGEIAEHLLLKPSDITSCLNNLSALRYITRERYPHNRRQREVKLTAKGRKSLQELTPRVFDALYEAGPSSDAMIQVLIETASALVRARRHYPFTPWDARRT